MKLLHCFQLVLLLVLAICSNATRQPQLSLFQAGDSIITIERDPNKKCLQNISECTSCNEGILCRPENNELIQIAKVTCLKDSNTPYCNPDTGLCTSTPPDTCGLNQFICPPTDGVYPDPWSCSRYYVCGNGVAIQNNCPRNNVYDHTTGQCKLRRRVSDCVNFNCVNKDGQPVVYPLDDRIWGRCVNGRALILGRCKDYEKYDLVQSKCVRVCRGTGNQPGDPSDCRKYIFCAEIVSGKYEPIELSCACNQGYDEELNRCVRGAKCLENLKKPLCESPKNNNDANAEDSDKDNKEINNDNPKDNNNDNDNDSSQENKDAGGTKNDDDNNDKHATIEKYTINNAGNANTGNDITNGNDELNGNLVNGDTNGDNRNTGNIIKRYLSVLLSLLVNSSGYHKRHSNNSRLYPFIINNSGHMNTGNKITNADDKINGNVINGNHNGKNENAGNIDSNNDKSISSLIINNAGDGNANNKVLNGNDNVDGNLVNGNNNGANNASGNIKNRNDDNIQPLIINNSENGNSNNNVSNGDDSIDRNLVNGNHNGDNSNSGNIKAADGKAAVSPLIINNSGSSNSGNNVANGNDDVDGNLVNGNNDADITNSGNVSKKDDKSGINPNGNDNIKGNLVNGNDNGEDENSANTEGILQDLPVATYIINNSGNRNTNNSVSNGNDVSGNLVNGDNNGNNENSGNINDISTTKKTKRSTTSELESEPDPEYLNFLNIVIQWIIHIIWQQ